MIKVAAKKANSCLRVNGDLNMTRSMGDVKWKRPQAIISCIPDVQVITLNEKYQALVVASDGLWAYFSSEVAVNYVTATPLAEEAARNIVEKIKSLINGTSHRGDNTSVTVVRLHWGQGRMSSALKSAE